VGRQAGGGHTWDIHVGVGCWAEGGSALTGNGTCSRCTSMYACSEGDMLCVMQLQPIQLLLGASDLGML
jgi:hypothetical protein